MKLPLSVSKSYAVTLAATFLLGLGSSGLCSPQHAQTSGYHTDPAKPRAGESSVSQNTDEGRQAQLLKDSLREIKAGDLSGASDTLAKLVRMAPYEPRYAQLLAIVRRQQEKQNWYRYQSHFRIGWAGN